MRYPNLIISFEEDEKAWNVFEINTYSKNKIKPFNMKKIGMERIKDMRPNPLLPDSEPKTFSLNTFIKQIIETDKKNKQEDTKYNIIVQACAPNVTNGFLRKRLNLVYNKGEKTFYHNKILTEQ